MRHIAFVIAAVLTLAVVARAESQTLSGEKGASTASEKRAGRQYSLLASPVGFTFPSNVDVLAGLSLGYFLNPDLILSADASFAGTLDADIYSHHDSINTFGVHAKQFVWSSLYVKAGLIYRTIRIWGHTPGATSTSEALANTSNTNVDEGALDFAVGNQWQIHMFTIGCDWFTVAVPLWKAVGTNDLNANFDGSNYEFTKLYLGVSF